MNWYEDPVIISAIIVSVPTAILAIITYLYMNETKLIRRSNSEPNFSVSPTIYGFMENTIHSLSLINSGQTAKAIQVKCSWTNVKDDDKTAYNYYIVSLGSNDKAILNEIPISELVEKKGKVTIMINCKDSRNKNYENKLEIDFGKLSSEGFNIAYQQDTQSNITDSLHEISRNLQHIENRFSRFR